MTVKELIEKLKEFNEDAKVEYIDYEQGYLEVYEVIYNQDNHSVILSD